ncbi:hypothetical protein BB559_003689 [Furculomyces boomerangus]|uniref:Uncharacterized protein n=1 Tax=Furculomyces boomerangus TaxID=61424 RepID=A0A2T9YJQ0_9FUNG|nr:hypothetical protein BB559_003689 [Furculomyces boomerangus]
MTSPLDQELSFFVNSFLGPPDPTAPLQEEYKRNSLVGLYKKIFASNYGKPPESEDFLLENLQKHLFKLDRSAKKTLNFKTTFDRIKKVDKRVDYSPILQVFSELSLSNTPPPKIQGISIFETPNHDNFSPQTKKHPTNNHFANLDDSFKKERAGTRKSILTKYSSEHPSSPHKTPRTPPFPNNPNSDGIYLSQLIPRIDKLSQEELVHDVLFVIQGFDGKYISWDSPSESYSIDPSAVISNPTMFILDRILEAGELDHKITAYINSKETSLSLVRQSFRSALTKELNEIANFISLLEKRQVKSLLSPANSTSNNGLSLKRIYVEIQPFIEILRILANMIESFYNTNTNLPNDSSLGGEMLSKIYTYTRDGAPNVRSLAIKMLKSASVPFNNILMRWITDGELEDPYKEFFVYDDKENAGIDGLWTRRYGIDVSKIPVYICSDLTRKIFIIGKSLSFLKIACEDDEWITLQIPSKDISQELGDPDILKEHVDSIYEKVNSRLMEVMLTKHNLMDHIAAMKKYLLLEQGDFVQCLVENLGSQLDKPVSRLLHHNIMAAVDSAVRSSNAQFDSLEFTDRISVRLGAVSSEESSNWTAFPITYHIDSPLTYVISDSTMLKYNELTTFLLRLKRIELHLHQLWQRQLTIKFDTNGNSKNGILNKSNSFTKKIVSKGGSSPQIRHLLKRLRICCGEMMHFVHQLERYIFMNAIEGSYLKFLKTIFTKDIPTIGVLTVNQNEESYKDIHENEKDGCRMSTDLNSASKDIPDKNKVSTSATNTEKKHHKNIPLAELLRKDLDLDKWIEAHENYISEVRRMVMGRRRNYINTVEHILNTINLFCISSDSLFNDMMGIENSSKHRLGLPGMNDNKGGKQNNTKVNLTDFANQLKQRSENDKLAAMSTGYRNGDESNRMEIDEEGAMEVDEREGIDKQAVDQVENTIATFKRDIRNMLKLFSDGTNSTFLKGLGVSFDLNQFYTTGNGK